MQKCLIGLITCGSGTTTIKVSGKEMEDILKIIKSLEDPSSLIKSGTKAII